MKTTEEKIKELRDEFNLKLDGILAEGKAAGYIKIEDCKVGKWYFGETDEFYLFQLRENGLLFGFYAGDWMAGDWERGTSNNWHNTKIRPATTSEIEKALIAEAERRGFKEGVKITRKNLDVFCNEDTTCGSSSLYSPAYNADKDRFEYLGVFVYCKGQWATILKDTPVTIAGEKVEYCTFPHVHVRIKGEEYSRKELNDLLAFMQNHKGQIKSLNAGCSGDRKITASDIQNLLDKWPV